VNRPHIVSSPPICDCARRKKEPRAAAIHQLCCSLPVRPSRGDRNEHGFCADFMFSRFDNEAQQAASWMLILGLIGDGKKPCYGNCGSAIRKAKTTFRIALPQSFQISQSTRVRLNRRNAFAVS
jgi:hypothetical protein